MDREVKLPEIERGIPYSAVALSQREGWDEVDLDIRKQRELGADGSRTVIFVADTGVPDHSDIPKPIHTINATSETERDLNNHSTWIVGKLSAINNDIGYQGICQGASVIPVKVLRNNGSGSGTDIERGMAKALEFWREHPKRKSGEWIIAFYSMSYGGGAYSGREFALFEDMIREGIVPCASAGNENRQTPSYPAAYENVIKVGAYDRARQKASFTNYGPWVDFVGPGVKVPSTVNSSEYAEYDGTSMSNPIVVGTLANFVSYRPNDKWIHDFHGLKEAVASHMKQLPGEWDGDGVFLPASGLTRKKHWIF